MSMTLAECRAFECAGCDFPFAEFLTVTRDGRRYCEPCATEYDQQATECADSDRRSFHQSKGVS